MFSDRFKHLNVVSINLLLQDLLEKCSLRKRMACYFTGLDKWLEMYFKETKNQAIIVRIYHVVGLIVSLMPSFIYVKVISPFILFELILLYNLCVKWISLSRVGAMLYWYSDGFLSWWSIFEVHGLTTGFRPSWAQLCEIDPLVTDDSTFFVVKNNTIKLFCLKMASSNVYSLHRSKPHTRRFLSCPGWR